MTLRARSIERPRLAGPISCSAEAGHVTGLIGPNGAGKTTLMRALAGLTEGPGQVLLGETPLGELSAQTRARRLAWMPAERRVDWPLAVRDIVALGLLPFRDPPEGAVERALERTETAALADRRIDRLSTGERARVLLARAIVGTPDVLILDEPTANLDPRHQLDIMALLRAEAERGAAVLVSLHVLELARRASDRLILMLDGGVLAAGEPAEVLSETNVRTAFGVRASNGHWERA
jgi:iron complex transport system ATP-binding protein